MYFERRESKKSKNGYKWSVRFYYNDEFGVRRRFSKSGFQTKKEAQEYGEKIKVELENNHGQRFSTNMTFNEVFEEYMRLEGDYKYSESTRLYYWNCYENHIKKSIGQMKIIDLYYVNVQKYFNSLEGNGKATNKNIKKVFSVAFKHALKSGYIKENPIPLIELRGKDTSTKQGTISIEQVEMIVDSLLQTKQGRKPMFSTYSIIMVLYIGFFLGLRKSETLALHKQDVDFENNCVYIDKRLVYHGLKRSEYHVTDKMKTKGSKAKLPLCKPLKRIFKQWFKYNPYDLICCQEDGSFLTPMDVDIVCGNHAKKLGIDFRIHMLRHSFVTNLVESGTNIKTVSELARHNDVRTTLQVYTQVSEDTLIEAINSTFDDHFMSVSHKKATNLEKTMLN